MAKSLGDLALEIMDGDDNLVEDTKTKLSSSPFLPKEVAQIDVSQIRLTEEESKDILNQVLSLDENCGTSVGTIGMSMGGFSQVKKKKKKKKKKLKEAKLSGASRSSLKLQDKLKGISLYKPENEKRLDKLHSRFSRSMDAVPTKRRRNNQRVRSLIKYYASLGSLDGNGSGRKDVATSAKIRRSRLKKTQIDHTQHDYPLIEQALSGVSRAVLRANRAQKELYLRNKLANKTPGRKNLAKLGSLGAKKAKLKLQVPTKRARNNQRVRREIGNLKNDIDRENRLNGQGGSKITRSERQSIGQQAKSERKLLRKSQVDHTEYTLINTILEGSMGLKRLGRRDKHFNILAGKAKAIERSPSRDSHSLRRAVDYVKQATNHSKRKTYKLQTSNVRLEKFLGKMKMAADPYKYN